MRAAIDARIDRLEDVYLKEQTFKNEIKHYARQSALEALARKVDRCAVQDKTVLLMDRLENMFN